jgi:hypothetical protein
MATTTKEFVRDKAGEKLDFHGIDTVHPPDALVPGKFPYAKNIRRYLKGAVIGRMLLTAPVETLPAAVHSIRRLNDLTPAGPVGGYQLIEGAADKLYAGATQVATGLSGKSLSLIPFRPNTSVQPWMYVGDSVKMLKVRSDGLCYKMGIMEPQTAPDITTNNSVTSESGLYFSAQSIPWTNAGGVNPDHNYGHTNKNDGRPPVIIACSVPGASLVVTVTGSATVNGATHAPGDAGSVTSAYPGQFVLGGSASIIVAAFTDGAGNVLPAGGKYPSVVSIGASATLTVPPGALQLQVGINSSGNTFNANGGNFTLGWTMTVSAVAPVTSLVGSVMAYYWGDSPHSGPVATYIWGNPSDTGGSSSYYRTISDAAGSLAGTSLLFDTLPGGGSPSAPFMWSTVNASGIESGTIPLFSPALEPEGYQDFNCCIVGNLFIPQAGTYHFQMTYKDAVMWGVGNGATWSGIHTITGYYGQTMTVVSELPLAGNAVGGTGTRATMTVDITFPGPGTYPIEIDYDYWYHSDRTLQLMISPTPGATPGIPPPLTKNVREQVQYRYVYRSTATGAQSNPSPASTALELAVVANQVVSYFSSDPQVDVVDYYRIDLFTADYTYIGTGPNDNAGAGGTNTPIVDELLDTELGNKLLEYDNFEPFPSIDLPRKGTVSINSGFVSWNSGDGFNTRWLPGTVMLIGSPNSVPYILSTRPLNATQLLLTGVPDGDNLRYEIAEPLLAAQPLPYLFGPTDNINFIFGVGDPLRPGTLYWSKGSNLDSAPDTNQMDVTHPSEPLQNGCMAAGRGVLFSTERGWVILPNFFNAQATAEGTIGSTWTLQETGITRGLYMPRCLAMDGGGNVFFRAKDGIEISPGGMGSKSITDEDVYNLFSHEGSTPGPVMLAGHVMFYPPDDTKPDAQRLSCARGYLYYDYQDINGNSSTLVFDIAAMGWVVDQYQWPVAVHALEEGPNINTTLAGCTDGSVRRFATTGAETTSGCTLLMPCDNAGDVRAPKKWGDLYVEVQ